MDRIYMNRIEGQRRIHVEIHENEVSDLLDDLKADPEHFASTRLFLGILRVAEETFSPAVAEGRRDRAARQASGQQPDEVVCVCDTEPESCTFVGDPDPAPHTCPDGEPCPDHDEPAAGLSDTQPANDRAAAEEARPAVHRWAVELHDPLAGEWAPGTRYLDRGQALAHLANVRAIGPRWKDGTPVDRRLVRETTTWTVEEDETR